MREEIIDKSISNPTIKAALRAGKEYGWSEQKQLEVMVIALADCNRFLTEELKKLLWVGYNK